MTVEQEAQSENNQTAGGAHFGLKIRKVQLDVIVTVIELSGELDYRNTMKFRTVLYDLMEGLQPYIILNLYELKFIDSQSLGNIICAINRLSKMKHGKLVLARVSHHVEMLFEMINPVEPAISYMTEEGALNEFRELKSEF